MSIRFRINQYSTHFLAAAIAAGFLALPVIAQDEKEVEPTSQPEVKLPAVADVLAGHIKAIGGEKAIRNYTSRKTTGTVEIPMQGMNGTMTSYAATPNKLLVLMNIPGVGDVSQGFDGKYSWNINPVTGPAIDNLDDTEEEKKVRLTELDFYADLNYPARFPSMETTGQTAFGGTDCWEIKCVGHDKTISHHYFDCESGLLRGFKAEVDTGMGMMQATSVFDDYKDFNGIKIATKQSMEMMGMTSMILTTTAVEWNKVEPKMFDLPQEIKTLVPDETEGEGDEKDKEDDNGGG